MQKVAKGKSFLLSERDHPVAKITPLVPTASEEEWEALLLRPRIGSVPSPYVADHLLFFAASVKERKEEARR